MERTIGGGRYELRGLLGQGAMGAVYEGLEVGTSRRVAVKLLLASSLADVPDVVARFEREARASAEIDSPHVVRVLDSGVDPTTGDAFMVMELLAGEDVHELARRLGPLPPELVLRIAAQACRGLERAHAAGVVHRDIKPANVFLARTSESGLLIKLLDFGIAKVRRDPLTDATAQKLTQTGAVLGSPLYMSPEQATGAKSLDARADLFSLGVMMYELLTGRAPHAGCATLGELFVAICSRDAAPVQDRAPWVPPEVAAIVHKALERAAARRYPTAAAMRAAIAALGGDEAIEEPMLAPVSPALTATIAARFEGAFDATAPDHTAIGTAPPWQLAVEQIEKRLTLRAPIAAVWKAISDAREFGAWFGVDLDGAFHEGVTTRGKTRPTQVDPEIAKLQEPYAGTPFELTVERLEAPRFFSFRWHPHALDPAVDYSSEPMTLVELVLAEIEGGGTRVTITESGFERLPPARRAAAFTSNDGGWTVQAKLIEKYLAHQA